MSHFFKRISRKIYKFFHPSLGVVLMLHRVMEQRSTLDINKKIEITPGFLERTIQYYRDNNYRFVSLDEVAAILESGKRTKSPFVCFTFDDGYADNYEAAYPIFKKYNCPFAIYITTDFPDQKAIIWWYVLEDILMQHDTIRLGDGNEYRCKTLEEKNETFRFFHKKINQLDPRRIESTFNDWFSGYDFSFVQKGKDLSLTPEQIQILASDSLCTIASHTVSHPLLTNLTEEQQAGELTESKYKLEQLIHKPVNHFAYPFGNHDDNSIRIAEQADYKTATIAWGGPVRKGQSAWRLTREALEEK